MTSGSGRPRPSRTGTRRRCSARSRGNRRWSPSTLGTCPAPRQQRSPLPKVLPRGRLAADVRPAGRSRSPPRGGHRGSRGTDRLTDTDRRSGRPWLDDRPCGRPPSTGRPLLPPLVLAGRAATRWTRGDGPACQGPVAPPKTPSGDLRHLRGRRADPAARHRPSDLGSTNRIAASWYFADCRDAGSASGLACPWSLTGGRCRSSRTAPAHRGGLPPGAVPVPVRHRGGAAHWPLRSRPPAPSGRPECSARGDVSSLCLVGPLQRGCVALPTPAVDPPTTRTTVGTTRGENSLGAQPPPSVKERLEVKCLPEGDAV